MKTIQVSVPEEIQNQILRYTQNQQFFVYDAIMEKLSFLEQKGIKELLVEGYQATADEDKKIAEDFKYVDLENWDEY